MRLRLTLEYDGTGFRGWAAQPGLRTVEGVMREALERVFPAWSELAIAGRTDTGVHALGNVASVEVEGGPPTERVGDALNAELPDDVSVERVGRGRAGLPRAPLGPGAQLRLPGLPAPHALRVRGAARLVVSLPARRGAPRRVGGPTPRRARLPRVHADRDAAQGLRSHRRVVRMAPPRRCARARDHGQLVPAPHGANSGRHDARTTPRGSSPGCSRDAPGGRLAPPLHRGAYTWSRSDTTESPCSSVWFSQPLRRLRSRWCPAAPYEGVRSP